MQSETKFKERVQKDLAKLSKVYILKTQETGRRGVPDLLISLNGKFVAIELKVDGERPTPLQAEILKRIQASNATAFYTTPSAWTDHLDMLKELARA